MVDFFLVLAGTYQNALDKILQTGDYTPEQKKKNALKSKISTIYWLVVTAIFLYYTLVKMVMDKYNIVGLFGQ